MGKSTTPKYIFNIRYKSNMGIHTSYMAWKKEYGRPTTANLAIWVEKFEQSCIDGCNKHLGYDPDNPIMSAVILLNGSSSIVAKWERDNPKKQDKVKNVSS